MNKEKLARLQNAVRTGGKGSVRRKKLVKRKNVTTDEKKVTSTIKKLGVNPIPGIDEVNIFNGDGTVLQFKSPKVQANIQANTYVVSGKPEQKPLAELLPGILSQMESVTLPGKPIDDEIPDLVGNFEEAAANELAKQDGKTQAFKEHQEHVKHEHPDQHASREPNTNVPVPHQQFHSSQGAPRE
eukprot:TRINITY_DN4596_c0_g4_i3.p1 TRINITY_DN4596_c0_g4~~TRINITY_DN4596_c0_g4_i3.p1  ORF type:complete len:185 (+),score=39.11 TRINITY_DN4596_c0_g4_i3:84-638(+)